MSMRSQVAIVGVGRTPYSRAKPGEPRLTADEYIAWAADIALRQAGLTKNDFDGQGLGVAHAEVAHTVNWSAATAENLGISPAALLRGDQGGASGASMLIRAAAMINAGIVDRFLVVGADTPLNIPSVSPGLPLSPERTRGPFWDFQGPFGVMGATAQFALVLTRYMYEHPSLTFEQMGHVAVSTRYNASFNPAAIYRTAYTLDEYLNSRMLSYPIRMFDCVPIVNGGLAYIVTSVDTARTLTQKPIFLRGFGESNNYYHRSRKQPDVTTTGFAQAAPKAMKMASIKHSDIDFFEPYDDYPFIVIMTLEDWGFCEKGHGGEFVQERDLRFHGDFPLSTDGGQLSGGQPGGAIGGISHIVESFVQLRGEAGERQVKKARIAGACGFGGIPYGRPGRSAISLILSSEP
jgi:acetyl-CoA acetyltransferase